MFSSFLPKSAKNKSGHILLVEDDRIVAASEVKLLKKLGYSVTVVSSGKDAVEMMNTNTGSINLVLMDIDLGHGMDGTAAVREILKVHDVPVLFLSGVSDPDTIERLDDVLSYGFVVKGSDISILDASIKMAFRLHDANTRLKSREQELLLLSNAIESSGDAIAISQPDAILRYVNPAFLKMWDYRSKDEVIGRPASDFWVEPEKASFVAQMVLMKGGWSGELSARSRDGTCFNADVNTSLVKDFENNPAGIIAIFRSNLARKLADQSVLENEERFRSLFENALEGIYQTTPDGRYLNMNPAFAAMFGYSSPEEMIVSINDIGRQIYVDPEVRERLKSFLNKDGFVKNFEAEVYKKDGSKFWISINARLIRGEDGLLDRYEGTNIDITERKISDIRIEEQKQKLIETNRQLESVNSELVASHREKELLLKEIKHRIRNNLNMISGILHLESEKIEDNTARSFFNDVILRINSMTAVYDRLYQSPDLKNINLAEYARHLAVSVFTSYKPAGSRVAINVSVDEIRLDVKRASVLGLILNELVSNSLKHGFPGGREGSVNVYISESGEIITLRVSDDGIGLRPGHDETVSTGIPLVRLLVKQVGGTLDMRVDAGTSVTISFRR